MRFLCALERMNTTSAFNQCTGATGAELTGVPQHLEILHLDNLVSQRKALRGTFEKYTLNNVREIHME